MNQHSSPRNSEEFERADIPSQRTLPRQRLYLSMAVVVLLLFSFATLQLLQGNGGENIVGFAVQQAAPATQESLTSTFRTATRIPSDIPVFNNARVRYNRENYEYKNGQWYKVGSAQAVPAEVVGPPAPSGPIRALPWARDVSDADDLPQAQSDYCRQNNVRSRDCGTSYATYMREWTARQMAAQPAASTSTPAPAPAPVASAPLPASPPPASIELPQAQSDYCQQNGGLRGNACATQYASYMRDWNARALAAPAPTSPPAAASAPARAAAPASSPPTLTKNDFCLSYSYADASVCTIEYRKFKTNPEAYSAAIARRAPPQAAAGTPPARPPTVARKTPNQEAQDLKEAYDDLVAHSCLQGPTFAACQQNQINSMRNICSTPECVSLFDASIGYTPPPVPAAFASAPTPPPSSPQPSNDAVVEAQADAYRDPRMTNTVLQALAANDQNKITQAAARKVLQERGSAGDVGPPAPAPAPSPTPSPTPAPVPTPVAIPSPSPAPSPVPVPVPAPPVASNARGYTSAFDAGGNLIVTVPNGQQIRYSKTATTTPSGQQVFQYGTGRNSEYYAPDGTRVNADGTSYTGSGQRRSTILGNKVRIEPVQASPAPASPSAASPPPASQPPVSPSVTPITTSDEAVERATAVNDFCLTSSLDAAQCQSVATTSCAGNADCLRIADELRSSPPTPPESPAPPADAPPAPAPGAAPPAAEPAPPAPAPGTPLIPPPPIIERSYEETVTGADGKQKIIQVTEKYDTRTKTMTRLCDGQKCFVGLGCAQSGAMCKRSATVDCPPDLPCQLKDSQGNTITAEKACEGSAIPNCVQQFKDAASRDFSFSDFFETARTAGEIGEGIRTACNLVADKNDCDTVFGDWFGANEQYQKWAREGGLLATILSPDYEESLCWKYLDRSQANQGEEGFLFMPGEDTPRVWVAAEKASVTIPQEQGGLHETPAFYYRITGEVSPARLCKIEEPPKEDASKAERDRTFSREFLTFAFILKGPSGEAALDTDKNPDTPNHFSLRCDEGGISLLGQQTVVRYFPTDYTQICIRFLNNNLIDSISEELDSGREICNTILPSEPEIARDEKPEGGSTGPSSRTPTDGQSYRPEVTN